jgi:sec-independent protein translocase protein TatA
MGGEFSIEHILVVLVVVLLLFGPQKLGDLGGGLGKGIRNFKKGIAGDPDPPPRRRKKKKKKRPAPELESDPVAELDEPAPTHQDA